MTSSLADPLVGRLVDGRYRILSHLADGGMASVYVAMDGRLQREVALKVMRQGLAQDGSFVDRFRSEARSAARLSHPNVVAVFDQGEDEGTTFLAMELVRGRTLRELVHAEGPLSPARSLDILEAVLEALSAAHTSGIVHRDVKPENVLLGVDGSVKVADFGLARAATPTGRTSASGVLLGTVSYTAPEQVERGSAGPRSDVYAAGLVLFEMLTGTKAVTGDNPIQIAYRHVHGTIPAPSSLVPELTPALDDLVARATATDPQERYASAADFLAGLRAVRAGLAPHVLHRDATTAFVAPVGATGALGPSTATLPGTTDDAVVERTLAVPEIRRRADIRRDASRGSGRRLALGAGDGRRHRAGGRGVVLAAVAAVAALVVGLLWWNGAGPGATTTVPAFVGLTLDEASAALGAQDLGVEASEEFSDDVPAGTVISGVPDAGTEVRAGTVVSLVVSKGVETFAVPKLVGTRAADAKATLAAANLALGGTKEKYDDKAARGVVVSQEPAAGAKAQRGTKVSLVVSKGPRPVAVPSVVGQDPESARATLERAGLTVKRGEDVFSGSVPAGRVAAQSPADGTLAPGATVTIAVSKGSDLVTVPDVTGRAADRAEQILREAGLDVRKEEGRFGRFFDRVHSQDPAPGSKVPKGTVVTIRVF